MTGTHQYQTKNIFHHHILSHPSLYWVLPEKKITWINLKQQGISRSDQENHMKSPFILVSDLIIFEGCNTNFWSFSWSSFLSGILKAKVKTLKIPGAFSKKYVLNHFGKLGWESIEKICSGAGVSLPEETIKSRK